MALTLFDDTGRQHVFPVPARRVVSLVPSDTYSVVRLGGGEQLVGRTDWCVEPAGLRQPALGGTKDPRIADIVDLGPDLVLANKEENTRQAVAALVGAGLRVFVSFPQRVAEGLSHLARIARMLGRDRDQGAKQLVGEGYAALRAAEARRYDRALRAFVPIWMDPLMTVHETTFISDMMALVGLHNVFADRERRYPLAADLGKAKPLPQAELGGRDTRYPRVTFDEVVARAPEVVLLPDEPHPFSDADAKLLGALDVPAARLGTIVPCPGKDLSWAGAQSVVGIARMQALADDLRRKVGA